MDTITILKERELINDTIRSFLKSRGYMEVETPLLVASPDMEPMLTPFETTVTKPDGTSHQAGLITSPEYSMKKLLGLGAQKIFTLTKVFRNNEEFGNTHNPEFTMLEWYTQGEDFHTLMQETEDLIKAVFVAFGKSVEPFEKKSLASLFQECVGIELAQSRKEELKQACEHHDIHTDASDTESDLFYRLFLAKIEPMLASKNIFVHSYPVYQAALSRLSEDKKFGERFELYYQGLELCNGFTELTDPVEQRKRFEYEHTEREKQSKPTFPIDENLLSLLASIRNPSFGNALGVDRLHMIVTNRSNIDDVLPLSASMLF